MTTTNGRKKAKPTEEWGKFMTRLLRAYGARATGEDPWVVKDMLAAQATLDEQIVRAVASLVHRGYDWTTIGDELGIGKNAAYKRYAAKTAPIVAEMAAAVAEQDRTALVVAEAAVATYGPDGAAEWAQATPALAEV